MTEPDQPLSRRAAREAERLAAEARQLSSAEPTAEPQAAVPPVVVPPVYVPQRAFSDMPAASAPPSFSDGASTAAFTTPLASAEAGAWSAVIAGPEAAAGPAPAVAVPLSERVSAWFSRHRVGVKLTAAVAALLALCVAAVVAGVASVPPPAPPVVEAGPAARVVPESVAGFARARSCVIEVADAELAMLGASVVNAVTGETLLDRAATEPAVATNEVKLLTAALAVSKLGPASTLSTRVYAGSVKGTIVIVAGGDPTLSALAEGSESVYSGAPKIADLAAQTRSALDELYPPVDDDDKDDDGDDDGRGPDRGRGNGPGPSAVTPGYEITQIVVDVGLWGSSDRWISSWPEDARTAGVVAPVTPLMVDGAREDPTKLLSPRSADPVADAVSAFVEALDLASAPSVSTGSALSGATLLGEVHSQPVSTLVSQMLELDDNTLAESLARVASATSGSGGTAASLSQQFAAFAAEHDVRSDGMVIADASGVSAETVIPPATLAGVFAAISADSETLGLVRSALPVAGVSGPFVDRFTAADATVRSSFAGLGTPTASADSLGGIVTGADGSTLALSLQVGGAVSAATTTELEAIVSRIKACGDNLAGIAQAEPAA